MRQRGSWKRQIQYVKYGIFPNKYLISRSENFARRHSFFRVSWKIYVSTKFSHQEISSNIGILWNGCYCCYRLCYVWNTKTDMSIVNNQVNHYSAERDQNMQEIGHLFLDRKNKRIVFNAVVKFHISYCPWVWMLISRRSTNLITRIHGRSLRLVYDTGSTF